MTTVAKERCTMLYVCDAYFLASDLAQLYCAYPDDDYGVLVYLEDDIADLRPFSASAQGILRLAAEQGFAWLRLAPDVEPFETMRLPSAAAPPSTASSAATVH